MFSAGDCLLNMLHRGEVVQHFIITKSHSLHTKVQKVLQYLHAQIGLNPMAPHDISC